MIDKQGNIDAIIINISKNISDRNSTARQFIRFCLVGSVGASINYGGFYLFYKIFSVYYVVSSLLGFLISAAVVFFINRQWTFCVNHGRITKQFAYFNLLIGFSAAANVCTIYFLTHFMNLIPEFSQLAAMVVTTIINFLGSKMWVFRLKEPQHA